MRRYLLTFLSLVLFLGQSLCLSAQTQTKESKLLMTIGCISDTHCEYDLLTAGDANTVKLRATFPQTMQLMKQQENIDVILCGGDVTGLESAPQANWERSRELFVNEVQKVFNEGYDPHVLVAAGNHEYQAGGGGSGKGYWVKSANYKYNSADYYSTPMMTWNGELDSIDSRDCFYESPSSAPKERFLAAYHYNIKGIDFVVLNTAKYLYESCDDYSYSKESAQWCVKKIDELYKKNPNGTVFFVMHIPFGDSNSISKESKGISSKDGASDTLKIGLARHPNTIVLYGHDHGGDLAYTREKTSQRLTRYDTSGNKMSSITDVNHVDGTEQDTSAGAEPSNASFISLFMGSMRYYDNKIDGSYISGPNGNDTDPSKVIQALIVYVYEDRIELRMKNYGEARNFGTVTVNKDLTPYTIFRKVVRTTDDEDDDEGGEGTGGSTGVPVEVYTQTEVGSGWVQMTTKDNILNIDDANLYGFRVDKAYDFDAINYSRIFSSTSWQAWYVPFDLTLTYDILSNFSFAKIQGAMADTNGTTSIAYVLLKAGDVVKANTPYVIKAKNSNASKPQVITALNTTLQLLPADSEHGFSVSSAPAEYGFYGIYSSKVSTDENTDDWYALNKRGYYQQMEPGVRLKPFRIFMTITPRQDNPYAIETIPENVKVRVFDENGIEEENDADATVEKVNNVAASAKAPSATAQTSQILVQKSINGEWESVEPQNGVLVFEDQVWKGLNVNSDFLVEEVDYYRKFSQSTWQAWYVPFDMTLTPSILKNFSFAQIQGAMADVEGSICIAFVVLKAGDIIKANTPYVIKAKKGDSTNQQVIKIENAMFRKTVAEESGFNISSASDIYGFTGQYKTKVSTEATKDQWYAITKQGTFQHLAAGVALQPFRIYMTITPREDNPYSYEEIPEEVKIRVIGDDEFEDVDPTAINEIDADAQQKTGKWYNIQGIEVQTPSKGVYIKDGKKYLF